MYKENNQFTGKYLDYREDFNESQWPNVKGKYRRSKEIEWTKFNNYSLSTVSNLFLIGCTVLRKLESMLKS